MTSPNDLPPVPDENREVEPDVDAGTGPAHTVQAPDEAAGPSPADAARAVNPSGGPGLEVDENDDRADEG